MRESAFDAEARRAANRESAKQAKDAEIAELTNHLAAVDARLGERTMHKEAARARRLADEYDPTPMVRKMFIDTALRVAAEVPGPGAHSPRASASHAVRSDFGTTFSAAPYSPRKTYARDLAHDLQLKAASNVPGPPQYRPKVPRRSDNMTGIGPSIGTTFALPPELGRPVPKDAHDALRQISYLRGIPAPDVYDNNANPMQKHTNRVKMMPSTEGPRMADGTRAHNWESPSRLEKLMIESEKVPGPGAYDPSLQPLMGNSSRSMVLGVGTSSPRPGRNDEHIRSDLEIKMHDAAAVPGPGAYECKSTLRAKGSPRFGPKERGGGMSMIEAIQEQAKHLPGPGAYHPSLTFAQELEQQRYLRKVVKSGDNDTLKSTKGSPARSPRKL